MRVRARRRPATGPGMAGAALLAATAFTTGSQATAYGADNTVRTDGSGHLDASGNGGNDTFVGHPGADKYDGGPGTNRVNTRGGPDTCVSIEVITGGKCPAP